MSNIAILTVERWINTESCTTEREITLADLKGKQWRGNTLYSCLFICETDSYISKCMIGINETTLLCHLHLSE